MTFLAPAKDIVQWAGIPRKAKGFDDTGTPLGYQRLVEPSKQRKLSTFFGDHANVSPTSIIVAFRKSPRFDSGEVLSESNIPTGRYENGRLLIPLEDLDEEDLAGLLTRLVRSLEERLPSLSKREIDSELHQEIILKAKQPPIVEVFELQDESEVEDDEEDGLNDDTSIQYTPDSHVEDFYVRIKTILKALNDHPLVEELPDSELGIDKETLRSMLRPAALVDGQHRVVGALAYEEMLINTTPEHEPAPLIFPVTAVLDTDWAEHVFQFVVVNQSATKISEDFLGTIIATSLTAAEQDQLETRLSGAGIDIADYKLLGELINETESPFFGLIKQGFKNEESKLHYASLRSLAKRFRKASKTSYRSVIADLCERNLPGESRQRHKTFWLDNWKEYFYAFWSFYRERFSSDNETSRNFWGSPKTSNLFKKVTLEIVQDEFFETVSKVPTSFRTVEEFREYLGQYFAKLTPDFFSSRWNLEGRALDQKKKIREAYEACRTGGAKRAAAVKLLD